MRAGPRQPWQRKKRHKYGAKKVEGGGYSHASKLEASVHQMLQLREKAGEIEILQVQASVYLTEARILYKPDFKCRDVKTGQEFFCEAKGFETPEWKLKLRLWKQYGPAPLEIWKGTHWSPMLDKVVVPEVS